MSQDVVDIAIARALNFLDKLSLEDVDDDDCTRHSDFHVEARGLTDHIVLTPTQRWGFLDSRPRMPRYNDKHPVGLRKGRRFLDG